VQAPAGGQQQVKEELYFAAYDYTGQDQLQLTVLRGQKVLQQRHEATSCIGVCSCS